MSNHSTTKRIITHHKQVDNAKARNMTPCNGNPAPKIKKWHRSTWLDVLKLYFALYYLFILALAVGSILYAR